MNENELMDVSSTVSRINTLSNQIRTAQRQIDNTKNSMDALEYIFQKFQDDEDHFTVKIYNGAGSNSIFSFMKDEDIALEIYRAMKRAHLRQLDLQMKELSHHLDSMRDVVPDYPKD